MKGQNNFLFFRLSERHTKLGLMRFDNVAVDEINSRQRFPMWSSVILATEYKVLETVLVVKSGG